MSPADATAIAMKLALVFIIEQFAGATEVRRPEHCPALGHLAAGRHPLPPVADPTHDLHHLPPVHGVARHCVIVTKPGVYE